MKYLKIILAILAVVGIGIAAYFGYTKTSDVGSIGLPENQFTRRISQEIKDISNKPDSRFCKESYDIAKYHLDEYASQNRLGVDSTDVNGNNQNQLFLFKTLYSTYAEKFIAQADFVFNGSAWSSNDLGFIKSEVGRLRSEGKKSDCLENNGTVDKEFSRLTKTIDKYYSEASFINQCNAFSFRNLDLDKHFPISDAQTIINDAKTHLNELGIVKNSDVIRNGLTNIPQKILSAHVSYLTLKLNEYKEMYMYNFSLRDYEDHLYGLLKNDISQLDNTMYSGIGGVSPSTSKSQLMSRLESDHSAAKAYWNNRH